MVKISALPNLTTPADGDELAINDISATTTKKLTLANLLAWLLGEGRTPILRATRVYTGSTTWNKPAGMLNNGYIEVEAIGGGGGGGGAGTNASNGAGGGGGAYAFRVLTASSLSSSHSVGIGAAGAAGASGNNAGGAGGNTFLDSLIFAGAGLGGNAPTGAYSSANGGTASTGDLLINGGSGGPRRSGGSAGQPSGGDSAKAFGIGGVGSPYTGADSAGTAGVGYGAGGSGGYRLTGNVAGGAGTAGLLIIKEYY